jgi:hypothetical protein
MNREIAHQIIEMMVAHTKALSMSATLVHDILAPLLQEHPDLQPEGQPR